MNLFDGDMTVKIQMLVKEIKAAGIIIEEPKCNFDVEMTMDMLDDLEKVSAVLLFSGDSDFAGVLERFRVKNKKIFIVGVRGMIAKELFSVCDKYIDFGKFYTGKRRY